VDVGGGDLHRHGGPLGAQRRGGQIFQKPAVEGQMGRCQGLGFAVQPKDHGCGVYWRIVLDADAQRGLQGDGHGIRTRRDKLELRRGHVFAFHPDVERLVPQGDLRILRKARRRGIGRGMRLPLAIGQRGPHHHAIRFLRVGLPTHAEAGLAFLPVDAHFIDFLRQASCGPQGQRHPQSNGLLHDLYLSLMSKQCRAMVPATTKYEKRLLRSLALHG
jgi:hypothetical protein